MGQTCQPAYFSSVLPKPACQQGLSKVGQALRCLLQFQILRLPDSQVVINGAVWWLGNCWNLRPCLAQHTGIWSRRGAKVLHSIMQVYIYIKMRAAGSQWESPGAKAATLCPLRFLSLHLCWSDLSPRPHVRDCGHHIWDRMQTTNHDLRQSLTFPPVNSSADVYKCICNL